jgi:hypothetical protein
VSIWTYVSVIVAAGITIVVLGMAFAVLIALYTGRIDLKYLLAEPAAPDALAAAQALPAADGSAAAAAHPPARPPETVKASLSRFQFLIFTFVIAGVYLVLSLEAGRFVDIPANVVWLMGLSGGTYALSKGIKTAGDSAAGEK